MASVTHRLAALIVLVVLTVIGVAHAGSTPVQPGFYGSPKVSPNGNWLLFERFYGGGSRYTPPDTTLRIAHADGTAERELVGRRIWGSLDALWTPDNLIEVVLSQPDGSLSATLRRPEDGTIVRQLPVAPRA